ncbi:Acyl carrier protein [compost metagenome]
MGLNISERVASIIQDTLQVSRSEFAQTENLIELGMTSLSFVKLIVLLETEFNIEFDDDDFLMDKFEFLDDFVSYVQKKINTQ